MNNQIFGINENFELELVHNNEQISKDEPVFVLRARDCKALATIRAYQSNFSPTSEQWKVVQQVIDDFTKFREENPELMGEPEECY